MPPDIDPDRVAWERARDVTDRALRETVVGLGGPTNGPPRFEAPDSLDALQAGFPNLDHHVGNRLALGLNGGIVDSSGRPLDPSLHSN